MCSHPCMLVLSFWGSHVNAWQQVRECVVRRDWCARKCARMSSSVHGQGICSPSALRTDTCTRLPRQQRKSRLLVPHTRHVYVYLLSQHRVRVLPSTPETSWSPFMADAPADWSRTSPSSLALDQPGDQPSAWLSA